MARNEQPKEDLIRQATALVQRVAFQIDQLPITVGFRNDGACSLFFDEEPVYHFNAANELRRAFDKGWIKAEKRRLVRMVRQRTPTTVHLVSTPLTHEEQTAFLNDLKSRCNQLCDAIGSGKATEIRQHPPDANLLEQARQWMERLADPILIAERPHVR